MIKKRPYKVSNSKKSIGPILDEKNIEEVKQIIREKTGNFTNTKGGMFTSPLESFEGSF